jgi:hypothetical protein
MIGVHQGVVARLRVLVPYLVGTHCIAHREALAANDINNEFLCLGFIDRVANKVYEWLGRSVIRQGTLVKLLLAFCEKIRVILFRTVDITRHDHRDDGFLYACNFGA